MQSTRCSGFSHRLLGLACVLVMGYGSVARAASPSADEYDSIQAAIDANPGKAVFVPAGDFAIDAPLMIETDGTSLWGPGRIIQTAIDQSVILIRNAHDVSIRELTLTRPEVMPETGKPAIFAENCTDLELRELKVLNNRANRGAITLVQCTRPVVADSLIRNYHTIAVDDRSEHPALGYAFRCIAGSGIKLLSCQGGLIRDNTIIEDELRSTPEIREEHDLGTMFKMAPLRGRMIDAEYWDAQYFPAWHQGTAIEVHQDSQFTRVLGNHIENAGQGIDNHADHTIISGNTIDNAFLGMKAMHGSTHTIITGNQFSRNDIWSIMLMPGAGSHAALQATEDQAAKPSNSDGGTIVANNVIANFGYGDAFWVWDYEGQGPHCAPIALLSAQETDDPPLRDVILSGNMIYNSELDEQTIDGRVEIVPARYKFAIFVADDRWRPQNIRLIGNIIHPGEFGISNVDLNPQDDYLGR